MTDVALVSLSRFPDIFGRLACSVFEHEPDSLRRILVTSGEAWHGVTPAPGKWETLAGPEPFCFARNANLGMTAAGPDTDVLLINDDCELVMPVVETLRKESGALIRRGHDDETVDPVGLLSPQIDGGVGNPEQSVGFGKDYGVYAISADWWLCFVAVYIPASTRRLVGPLDERFTGYGGDDVDYSWRTRKAGLKLAITSTVRVKHGFGGEKWASSYRRLMSWEDQMTQMSAMNALAWEKHHLGIA